MRYAELQFLGGAWRVWAVTEPLPFVPQSNLDELRYVPLSGAVPPTYAVYDAPTQSFTVDGWTPPAPSAPAPSTRMSRLAFRSRFTEAEQVALEVAMDTHPNVQVRGALRVFDKNLSDANEVDLADPRTQLAIGRLVTFTLLTPARAAEILDPAWSPVA